jgi:Flp pilus assembly CpaE family ATPase
MDDRPISVLLIEDNPGDVFLVRKMLAEARGASFKLECADRLQTGLERLGQGGIDVVLLDLCLPDSQGPGTFEKARAAAPEVAIVLFTSIDDELLALRTMQMGAQDYLVKGCIDSRLLGRALRHSAERHRQTERSNGHKAKSARVLAFVGAKGGVGVTTVALNVGASLAKGNKSVIAVELRSNNGTFSQQVRHSPADNLSSLLDLSADQINEGEISSRLVTLRFGLRVLFGPQTIDQFRQIEPEKAEALLKGLARMADYIVVDLAELFSAAGRSTIQHCNYVGLVLDNELLSIAAGKLVLEQLKVWGYSRGSVGAIIVDRTMLPTPIRISDVAAQLGCGVLGVVRNATDVCAKAEKVGLPFVLTDPGNVAASAVADLAKRLSVEGTTALQKPANRACSPFQPGM